MADGRWTYRDGGAAAAWAERLLYLHAALSAAAVLIALARGLAAPEGGLSLLVGLAQMLAFVASAIVILRWIYLASANARALGAEDLMGRPGWAVAWFFIPLANLVMPFMTVRDIWKASANPKDWQIGSTPIAIPLWWTCWIISGIAGGIAFQFTLDKEMAASSGAQTLYLLSDLLALPSALLLARIIAGIQAMQARAGPSAAFA